MDSLGSLLDRPAIQEQFINRVPFLIASLDWYLNQNKEIYDEQMLLKTERIEGRLPYQKRNMPSISGTLNWSQELKDRVGHSIARLRQLAFGASAEGAEAMVVLSKAQEMNTLLEE